MGSRGGGGGGAAGRRLVARRGEGRYHDGETSFAAHAGPYDVRLSVQHSGSLRIYAAGLTLRYEARDPLWLDRAIAHLRSIGRRHYYVLDGDEVDVRAPARDVNTPLHAARCGRK